MEASTPRVALLGGGADELELLADLHAQQQVEIAGVYDPDPRAPAIGLAEILGIATGGTTEFRARLAAATHRVLPADPRRAARVESEIFHGETLTLEAARRRWGSGTPVPDPSAAAAKRDAAMTAMARPEARRDPSALADWLLDQAMRAVGANGGSLQRLTDATGELYMLAARGLSERLVRLGRHRVGEGIAGTVAATRASQLLHGAKPGRVGRERGQVTSSISVPLDDAAGLLGVLNVSTTLPNRTFDEEHVRALEHLSARIVELLRAAEAEEATVGDDAMAFARLLRHPSEAAGFDLQPACEALRQRLDADGVRLALATEDATWRVLWTAGNLQSTPAPSRARMARALVEDCWVHATESDPAADTVETALEHALEGGLSRVYAPLVGLRPVGVLVLEFRSLRAAEASLRRGRQMIAPLGLAVETLVRGRAQERRIARLATLAHFPKAWASESGTLLATLAQQAIALVGARAASVRRCDERARTYSRPALHGIDVEALAAWRRFDLQVTEHTLAARRSVVTTAASEEGDALAEAPPRRSLVSVPLQHEGDFVGVVNVYDRMPSDRADTDVFTNADREILEAFASLAAPFLAAATDPPRETKTAPAPPPPAPEPNRDAPVSVVLPAAVDRGGVAADSIAARLEAMLGTVPVRPIAVVLLHFTGLARVESEAGASLRNQVSARVQACLQGGETSGWWGSEDFVLASADSSNEPERLAERALAAVRPVLARHSAPEFDLDLRIGTSRAPMDGLTAHAMIEIAAERSAEPTG